MWGGLNLKGVMRCAFSGRVSHYFGVGQAGCQVVLGTVLIQKIMFSSNKYATLMRYHARNYNLIGWLMNKTIWVLLISSLLISTTLHAESCEKKWAKYYAGKSWFEPWCDTESYKRRHQDAYADEYIPSAGEIEAMHAEQEAKTAQAGKIAKAAKEGDATAQASLGWMFYKGGGKGWPRTMIGPWYGGARQQSKGVLPRRPTSA